MGGWWLRNTAALEAKDYGKINDQKTEFASLETAEKIFGYVKK